MPCSVLCLPDSLLLDIFTYFSHRELLEGPGAVCRRFYNVCRDASLWRGPVRLPVTRHALCDRLAEGVVSWGGLDVTVLRISGQKKITGTGLLTLEEYFFNLRHLELSGCTSLNPYLLAKALRTVGYRLHTLCLDENDLPEYVLDAIRLHSAPRLRSLSLRCATGFSYSALCRLLEHCHAAQHLFLEHLISKVLDVTTETLCSSCQNVQVLSLKQCYNVNKPALLRVLLLPHLRDLDVSGIPSVDRDFFGALGANCPTLRRLSAGDCPAVDDGAIAVLVQHQRRLHLEDLRLPRTRVSNIAMLLISRSPWGQRLRVIDVSHCPGVSQTAIMCLAVLRLMSHVIARHVETSEQIDQLVRSFGVKVETLSNKEEEVEAEAIFFVSRENNEFHAEN